MNDFQCGIFSDPCKVNVARLLENVKILKRMASVVVRFLKVKTTSQVDG